MTSDMVEVSLGDHRDSLTSIIKGFAKYGHVTGNPWGHFLDGFISTEREVNINVSWPFRGIRSGSLDCFRLSYTYCVWKLTSSKNLKRQDGLCFADDVAGDHCIHACVIQRHSWYCQRVFTAFWPTDSHEMISVQIIIRLKHETIIANQCTKTNNNLPNFIYGWTNDQEALNMNHSGFLSFQTQSFDHSAAPDPYHSSNERI